jgi:hypothetical protein
VRLNHQGIVAIIIASALGIVLVVMVTAISIGAELPEAGRSAAWTMIGALAGALITYLTAVPK